MSHPHDRVRVAVDEPPAGGDDHRPTMEQRHRHRAHVPRVQAVLGRHIHRAGVEAEGSADGNPGGRVPHPHDAVATSGEDDGATIELRRRHHDGVRGDALTKRCATGQVPDPYVSVGVGDDDQRAAVELCRGQRTRRGDMSLVITGTDGDGLADGSTGGQVPAAHLAVVAAGDDDRPVIDVCDRQRCDVVGVAGEGLTDGGTGRQVPPVQLEGFAEQFPAAGDDDLLGTELPHSHRLEGGRIASVAVAHRPFDGRARFHGRWTRCAAQDDRGGDERDREKGSCDDQMSRSIPPPPCGRRRGGPR
jgi:hypothetical protein